MTIEKIDRPEQTLPATLPPRAPEAPEAPLGPPPKPPRSAKPPKAPKQPQAPKAPKEPKRPRTERPPKPPKGERPPQPPYRERPPKPPRRPPGPEKPPIVLTQRETLIRSLIAVLAIMLLSFVLNLMLVSHIQYQASQQQLLDHFKAQLAAGVAPVSEGDVDDVLLADGVPVALLSAPSIGLETVVVEGTSSGDTMKGPGHRRDTALPGQSGVTVIMGRASAYGGPFGKLPDLQAGDLITVITGQGEHTYEVMGLRYAGDPAPPPITAGNSRMVLETARGIPYAPAGSMYIDARLTSEIQPNGARQTNYFTLPPEDKSLATDTTWGSMGAKACSAPR